MQIGQLALERDMQMMRAGNIARAARARAHAAGGIAQGVEHDWIFALAEVIVRAPDDDALRPWTMVARIGELAGNPLEIGKDAIAALGFHACRRPSGKHSHSPCAGTSEVVAERLGQPMWSGPMIYAPVRALTRPQQLFARRNAADSAVGLLVGVEVVAVADREEEFGVLDRGSVRFRSWSSWRRLPARRRSRASCSS